MFHLDRKEDVVKIVFNEKQIGKLVDFTKVKESFYDSDYSEFFLDEVKLDEAIRIIAKQKPKENLDQSNATFTIAIRKNAQVKIIVSQDKMQAEINLIGAYAGKNIDITDIKYKLQSSQVLKGIIANKLAKAVNTIKTLRPGEVFHSIIAKGKYPVKGTDARLEILTPTILDRSLKPKKLENSYVDMRDLGEIINVKTGTPLIKKHELKQGEHGFNITGAVIQAEEGADIELKEQEGTQISAADKNLLLASKTGVPIAFENSIKIDDILVVKDVDVASGHIRFKGSIMIEGDVKEGMVVESDGDVIIAGYVDSAIIKASGSIKVFKGIIGHLIQDKTAKTTEKLYKNSRYSCNLSSGGEISALFCQYAKLEAKNDITIENFSTHSFLKTSRDLVLGKSKKNAKGKIIGGILKVREKIFVGDIGSDAQSTTYIELAYHFAKIYENAATTSSSLRRDSKKLQNSKNTIADLYEQKDSWQDEINNEIIKYKILQQEIKNQKQKLEKLDIQIHNILNAARVFIYNKAFAKIHISLFQYKAHVLESKGPTLIKFDKSKLIVDSLISTKK